METTTISSRRAVQRPLSDHEAAIHVFSVLRARASRYAFTGTLIAAAAVVVATLLVCLQVLDGITINNIIRAHSNNMAMWALDAMPLLFAWWGQYASWKMADAAGSMVETRTDDLRRELEEARYTAQAKTDFFARMSHELRTPINAIIGMSELLLEADDPQQRQHHGAVIRDSAQGLLSLINDVLDFSRIEAGRMELDDVEFDLHDNLNGAAALLDQTARAKGIRLVCLVPPDAPRRVSGDPGRLRQIVINLVGNAIKFTDEGEVVLSLRHWERLEDGSHRLSIEVADTGIGITRAEQANLFEPYRQASGNAKGGTGLGLSITLELVRAMEGEITVESEPGTGTVFRFSAHVGATAAAPGTQEQSVELRGKRVLLLDPDEAMRASLADQLRALGMQVDTAADGVEAMKRILVGARDGNPFDVLLADMFAPHLSGEELGRRVKARRETRSTCVAIITTAGARGDAKRLNDAGFAGYLTRPIPPEHLDELLRAIVATGTMTEAERHRRGLVTRYHARGGGDDERPVLVVDDSEINREITLGQLARLSIPGEAAATGDAALDAARSGRYAAILLDLQLGDTSGIEVIGRIRALGGSAGAVPVLVLTAGATADERRRCAQAGASDLLLKPIDSERLGAAIAAHAATGGAAPGPAPDADEAAAEPHGATLSPELARVFLREASGRLEQMRAAITDPLDRETVARNAHALKSASQHFPGSEFTHAAQTLERLALESDAASVRTQQMELERCWEALRAQLESAIGPRTASS